jgi:hypothetical protein
MNKISARKLVDVCCITLIILIFACKVSLKSLQVVPYSMPPIIFQYGLHPYINFGLQVVIAVILFAYWIKNRRNIPMNGFYKIFIFSLIAVLSIQTFFQIAFVNVQYSPLVQLGGLGMAIALILIYGLILPAVFPLEKLIYWICQTSTFICVASFLCLPALFPNMFRGGRYVGFFKHIPHMVTASTVAFIFYFPRIFEDKPWTLKNNTLLRLLTLGILTLTVLLTSTKAAFITIFITSIVGILIFGSKKRSVRLFKFTFLSTFLIAILLVGAPATQFMYEITTGKASFGMRPAQDGIKTRMEEVTRGMNMFEKSPYFGLGLLYKYLNGSEDGIEVESYNSFKDPHNLFVSSGVIGGYPLFIMSFIAFFMMIIASFKGLNESNPQRQIMGLFLLAHLPVFIVYHANFSLGGMGDRIYWLVFGYLGQNWAKDYELASEPLPALAQHI